MPVHYFRQIQSISASQGWTKQNKTRAASTYEQLDEVSGHLVEGLREARLVDLEERVHNVADFAQDERVKVVLLVLRRRRK